jgi:Predicted membrane protein
MEILHIILASLGSIITLFILTKVMGYRQMSQLSMFDYINGITIGSIAAEMATSLEDDYLKPLTAMIIYALIAILLSTMAEKSIILRRFFNGKAIILYNNGNLYRKNLKKSRIDLQEFLVQCRGAGYFDISQLQTAILECNGKISFLPLAKHRPATPNDLNLTPETEAPLSHIIIDGNLMRQNLRHTGNNEKWLHCQLKAHGLSDYNEVFLATCDIHNNFHAYVKIEKENKTDTFE